MSSDNTKPINNEDTFDDSIEDTSFRVSRISRIEDLHKMALVDHESNTSSVSVSTPFGFKLFSELESEEEKEENLLGFETEDGDNTQSKNSSKNQRKTRASLSLSAALDIDGLLDEFVENDPTKKQTLRESTRQLIIDGIFEGADGAMLRSLMYFYIGWTDTKSLLLDIKHVFKEIGLKYHGTQQQQQQRELIGYRLRLLKFLCDWMTRLWKEDFENNFEILEMIKQLPNEFSSIYIQEGSEAGEATINKLRKVVHTHLNIKNTSKEEEEEEEEEKKKKWNEKKEKKKKTIENEKTEPKPSSILNLKTKKEKQKKKTEINNNNKRTTKPQGFIQGMQSLFQSTTNSSNSSLNSGFLNDSTYNYGCFLDVHDQNKVKEHLKKSPISSNSSSSKAKNKLGKKWNKLTALATSDIVWTVKWEKRDHCVDHDHLTCDFNHTPARAADDDDDDDDDNAMPSSLSTMSNINSKKKKKEKKKKKKKKKKKRIRDSPLLALAVALRAFVS